MLEPGPGATASPTMGPADPAPACPSDGLTVVVMPRVVASGEEAAAADRAASTARADVR